MEKVDKRYFDWPAEYSMMEVTVADQKRMLDARDWCMKTLGGAGEKWDRVSETVSYNSNSMIYVVKVTFLFRNENDKLLFLLANNV